jgi:hypothetical protein
MDELEKIFQHTLAKALANTPNAENEEVISATADQVLKQLLPRLTSFMLKTYKRMAPKVLRREQKKVAGFNNRNYMRWRKAFDTLEMMWMISEEIGSELNNKHRPQAVRDKDYLFEALTYLHARSLLVTREAMCLMHNGFADGAMSRWRTLHELATIASFVHKHGIETAHRYLASHFFNSYRAATQLNIYAERANLEPFTAQQIAAMKNTCDVYASRFGEEMWSDYGWAAFALGIKKPTFASIEQNAGLDHWRPRYKWASQHTHGPHRPAHALLGVSENEEQVFLVGQSNSGMVDPIQMIALTLTISSTALFVSRPNIDSIVAIQVLTNLSEEIGPLAMELERRSYQKAVARKLKKQNCVTAQ